MYDPACQATHQPVIPTATCGSEMCSKLLHNLTSFLVAALALLVIFYAPAANGQGKWQTVPAQMPINPIHTALMSNGKILVVSGSENNPLQTIFNVGVGDPSSHTINTQLQ